MIADRKAGDEASAKAAALVRTAIEEPEELTPQIIDANRPSIDMEHFVCTGRDRRDRGNDVLLHGPFPLAPRFPRPRVSGWGTSIIP